MFKCTMKLTGALVDTSDEGSLRAENRSFVLRRFKPGTLWVVDQEDLMQGVFLKWFVLYIFILGLYSLQMTQALVLRSTGVFCCFHGQKGRRASGLSSLKIRPTAWKGRYCHWCWRGWNISPICLLRTLCWWLKDFRSSLPKSFWMS